MALIDDAERAFDNSFPSGPPWIHWRVFSKAENDQETGKLPPVITDEDDDGTATEDIAA